MLANPSALDRYGRVINTHDVVKCIAMATMIIDHVGWYLLDDNPICRLIGRAAAPLFFFLVGYSGKVHLSVWLLGYGIILSCTTGFWQHHFWINILLNFVAIHFLFQKFPLTQLSTHVRIISTALLWIINPILYPFVEYGTLGILLAFSAHSLARQEPHALVWFGVNIAFFGFWQLIAFHFEKNALLLIFSVLLFMSLFWILIHYELKPLPMPAWLTLPILIVSRYSLQIYFFHVIFLQGRVYFKHLDL